MNVIPQAMREQVRLALLSGSSIRETMRVTGVARATVRRLQRELVSVETAAPKCQCGRKAGHQGWCSVRYLASAARQAFVNRWEKGRAWNAARRADVAAQRANRPKRQWNSARGNLPLLRYPYMADSCFLDGLTEHVHSVISARIPEQFRGDVCQDVICAILSGELRIDDLKQSVSRFVTAERNLLRPPRHRSIDTIDYSNWAADEPVPEELLT